MHLIFTVVIPSYNQAQFIEEAIQSVLGQTGDFYIDLIIQDGGSSDGAADIIKKFETQLKANCAQETFGIQTFYVDASKQFIRCSGISYRWISQKDNGFTDAINQGIDLMFGDIFSYLNTDDYLLAGALATVAKAFAQNVEADIVYGEGLEVTIEGKLIHKYPAMDVNSHKLADQNCMPQPSVFVKGHMIDEAGKFNEKIKNSIDYEYWLRLQAKGAKFLFVQEVLSATRIHENTKTLKNRKQIIEETLAIQSFYGGDLWKVNTEFMWGMSVVGRYSSLLPKSLYFIRRALLKVMTLIWLSLHINQLRQLGVSLMS